MPAARAETRNAARPSQAERRLSSERRLVDAAIRIIAEQGVEALTFEAISERSGLSRGLGTQRFGSKAGLIAAALETMTENRRRALREVDERGTSGLDSLLAFMVRAFGAELHRSPVAVAHTRLFCWALSSDEGLRPYFRASNAEVAAFIAAWLARGQADGSIRRDIDPSATALSIGAMLHGVELQFGIEEGAAYGRLGGEAVALVRRLVGA